jgi:hypothetical protein
VAQQEAYVLLYRRKRDEAQIKKAYELWEVSLGQEAKGVENSMMRA